MKNEFPLLVIKDIQANIQSIMRSEKHKNINPTLSYFCEAMSGNILNNIQYGLNKV